VKLGPEGARMIDSKEASAALSDIDEMIRRVRQSQTYDLASLIMILWGVLVFAGNVANYLWLRHGIEIWITVNVVGSLSTLAILYFRSGRRGFEIRMMVFYLLFFAFGYLCTKVLGDFTPRQLGTFWPIYFMLFYAIAGLWFGSAFVLIAVVVSVLTLIGYFYVGESAFLLWMAFVNGGGLILGGLWMRRD
jgi:hypothetical protein